MRAHRSRARRRRRVASCWCSSQRGAARADPPPLSHAATPSTVTARSAPTPRARRDRPAKTEGAMGRGYRRARASTGFRFRGIRADNPGSAQSARDGGMITNRHRLGPIAGTALALVLVTATATARRVAGRSRRQLRQLWRASVRRGRRRTERVSGRRRARAAVPCWRPAPPRAVASSCALSTVLRTRPSAPRAGPGSATEPRTRGTTPSTPPRAAVPSRWGGG